MMDTSDGLADACLRLALQNHVDVLLDADALPLHTELQQAERERLLPSARKAQLYGGEDFGLLALMPTPLWEAQHARLTHYGWRAVGRTQTPKHPEAPQAGFISSPTTGLGEFQAFSLSQTFQHFALTR
jgi:thiamine monophosphate kinase